MSAEDVNLTKLKQSKVPIIWVVGGPGSGKATECQKLATKYGFVHILSGDLLRAEIQAKTPRGKQIEDQIKKGQLVADDIVFDLVKQAIVKSAATAKGYLIDGYPRKVEQAKEFEAKIKPATLIIYLEATDDTMNKRILERKHPDDNAESIKKRLATFHSVTEPIAAQYKAKVVKIDANGAVDTTLEKIRVEIDKALTAAGLPVPK